jgi:two-component system CheB/CheR fusion protein
MTDDVIEEVEAMGPGADDLDLLMAFVKEQRGFDFTGYKRGTLDRRVAKRMQIVGATTRLEYTAYLEENPDEFVELFNTILINVTQFFRDPDAWDYLADEIVPRMLERSQGEPIRIWCAGCATGEEAYSLAILMCEALGEEAYRARVKIYATDLDDDALGAGRRGLYAPRQLENVAEDLRERYFDQTDNGYAFRSDLRRAVVFGRHDLIQDPPISRIDLVSARNTLMYFGPEAQARVLGNFHFALNPDGFLFLGRSEMLLTRSELFVPVELKRRVFTTVPLHSVRERMQGMVLPGDSVPRGRRAPVDDAPLRYATMEATPVAQLVVDTDGILALANPQARRLFGLSTEDIGRPIDDLELAERPIELRPQLERAATQQEPIAIREVEWAAEGELRWFDVEVSVLHGADGLAIGTGVTFGDVTHFRHLREVVEHSKETLETAYEELQSTAEELETTNEELQSTNEELETTNEEIQSTNEELETMNEELQSTNEELETINDELQERTETLDEMNAFLESILGSLRHTVVVLDRELRVQAWNIHATELWGLRADEAQGEHFLNIDIGLPVEHIAGMLRGCLTNQSEGKVELDGTDRRGRPIRVEVSCSALRGKGDEVRGVIVQMEAHEA